MLGAVEEKLLKLKVSIDSGKTWKLVQIQSPVLPKAHTRFRYLFKWDGKETTILSRAIDETGYTQPDRKTLIRARGAGSIPYHSNPITGWRLKSGGDVVYRVEDWDKTFIEIMLIKKPNKIRSYEITSEKTI